MTDETPAFPSREHSVEHFCKAAADVLEYIAHAQMSLTQMEACLRAGDVPLGELETLEFEVTGIVAGVRTTETWYSHEQGRAAQEQADINGFMAEFERLMNDGSLGAHNARAIMSMNTQEVVAALLARVGQRPPATEGWTMQPFQEAVAARLAELRPVVEPAPEVDTDDTGDATK